MQALAAGRGPGRSVPSVGNTSNDAIFNDRRRTVFLWSTLPHELLVGITLQVK